MTERLVVIGGDAAGMSAASQARRRRGPDDLSIVVFEMSGWVSYSACGEPYFISGDVPELNQLIARTPEQFAAQDIQVHLHHEVVSIDTTERTVTARTPDGAERVEPYDQLVYATGATPVLPPIEGIDLPGVFPLKSLDDAAAIDTAVRDAKHAVVIGGGYIGLELAEAFFQRGLTTTLVTSGSTVMNRALDPDMGELVTSGVRERGVRVVTGSRVRSLHGSDHVTGVVTDEGVIEADIVGLGLGSAPVAALAGGAGIALGPTGAVAVDDHQRTSVDGVWSAGDCAEAFHRLSGQPANVHLGTVANKQGRVLGMNLGGEDTAFPGILGTAITKFLDLEIARTGLSEFEATAAGVDYVAATTGSTTTAGYWPESAPMTLKVLAERGTGRLLGAQIVGGRSAGKRIDTLATGIWNNMDGISFSMMDLSYAPPFSGTWDPVLVAARRAAERA